QHFKLLLAIDVGNLDDGDVEGATTQVVDGDYPVAAGLVHTVGQGRGGGLVDDALDIEAGDAAGVLGGLALGVVEVGGHGDHRLGDGFPQVVLGGLLHFLEHFRRDLGRRLGVPLDPHPGIAIVGLDDFVGHHFDVLLDHIILEATTDQALHRIQGVLGVGHRLALGGLTHQHFAILGKGYNGGRGPGALGVFDNPRLVTLQHRDAGVGGAEVNSNNLTHYGDLQ